MDGIPSRETFRELPDTSKLDILYDMCMKQWEKLEEIERQLIHKRKIDSALAGMAGFLGGLIGVLGKNFLTSK